jgi:hypothetical protein
VLLAGIETLLGHLKKVLPANGKARRSTKLESEVRGDGGAAKIKIGSRTRAIFIQ